jgi:hypothetical protein
MNNRHHSERGVAELGDIYHFSQGPLGVSRAIDGDEEASNTMHPRPRTHDFPLRLPLYPWPAAKR